MPEAYIAEKEEQLLHYWETDYVLEPSILLTALSNSLISRKKEQQCIATYSC